MDLEDRLLNGRGGDNYCSSSEDEDGATNSREGIFDRDNAPQSIVQRGGKTCNTGPKGVMEDWRRYKQLQTEKRDEQEKEMVKLAKHLSMTCSSEKKEKNEEDDIDLDDEFMREYAMKRIHEMKNALRKQKSSEYGTVFELADADAFLNVTDDCADATVLVHIYSNDVECCTTVRGCMLSLAPQYPTVKFCQVQASILGTSVKFQCNAVPTLQAYRDGQLICSMVRVQDELGNDFFADKLQQYLIEHGVLPDVGCDLSPKKIKGKVDRDSDSDFDLD